MPNITAYGSRGMVASGHPLAAAIGLEVLRSGGNAADAAIATVAAEWVLLPHLCGPGGDAYALAKKAGADTPVAITGSGVAPDRMLPDWFHARGQSALPLSGPLSPGVPGAVAALGDLLAHAGSMAWDRLLAPAVALAEEGAAVNARVAAGIAEAAGKVAKFQTTARIYLPGGRAPAPGDVLVQADLGRSLRRLASAGPGDFYTGRLADQLLSALDHAGGFFSGAEWAAHKSEFTAPLAIQYRGHTVYSTAPPSQGILLLQCLNLLERFPLRDLQEGSAELIHLMVEAKKLAFADRLAYLGDPRTVAFNPRRLLSDGYARRRSAELDPAHSREHVPPGTPPERDGDTSFLCSVDADGNAVGWIHSLSGRTYGSAWVAGDTGIILNSRAGRGFTLEPGHPNLLAPGKRTMHTLGAWMVFAGRHPRFVGGTPGGDQQPQWNLQTVVRLLDFGMEPAAAAAAPRWTSFPGTDPEHVGKPFALRLEAGFTADAVAGLEAKGHRVEHLRRRAGGGGVQIIGWKENGVLWGGSDPRSQGAALAW